MGGKWDKNKIIKRHKPLIIEGLKHKSIHRLKIDDYRLYNKLKNNRLINLLKSLLT